MNVKEAIAYFKEMPLSHLKGKIIGLVGDLGVGKTHFVKNLLKNISDELEPQVSSPTYNLCNTYQVGILQVYHFDLYRIEEEDELYDTGIFDAFEQDEILAFVEWVDLFPNLSANCDLIIHIEMNQGDKRKYTIKSNH